MSAKAFRGETPNRCAQRCSTISLSGSKPRRNASIGACGCSGCDSGSESERGYARPPDATRPRSGSRGVPVSVARDRPPARPTGRPVRSSPPRSIQDRVDVRPPDRWGLVGGRCFVRRGQSHSELSQGAQHKAKAGPRLAALDLADPKAADPHPGGQAALIQPQRKALRPDETADIARCAQLRCEVQAIAYNAPVTP